MFCQNIINNNNNNIGISLCFSVGVSGGEYRRKFRSFPWIIIDNFRRNRGIHHGLHDSYILQKQLVLMDIRTYSVILLFIVKLLIVKYYFKC